MSTPTKLKINHIRSSQLDDLIRASATAPAIASAIESSSERNVKLRKLLLDMYCHYDDFHNPFISPLVLIEPTMEMHDGELIRYDYVERRCRKRRDDYIVTWIDKYTHETKSVEFNLQELQIKDDPKRSSYLFVFFDETNNLHAIVFGFYQEPSTKYCGKILDCNGEICAICGLDEWCGWCNDDPLDDKNLMYQISHLSKDPKIRIVGIIACGPGNIGDETKNPVTVQIYPNVMRLEMPSAESYTKYFNDEFEKIKMEQRTLCDNAVGFLKNHPNMEEKNKKHGAEVYFWSPFDDLYDLFVHVLPPDRELPLVDRRLLSVDRPSNLYM